MILKVHKAAEWMFKPDGVNTSENTESNAESATLKSGTGTKAQSSQIPVSTQSSPCYDWRKSFISSFIFHSELGTHRRAHEKYRFHPCPVGRKRSNEAERHITREDRAGGGGTQCVL